MTIRQLSDAFGLDPSTLNRQTSALMRAGLLERIPDPDGGIARKFRITGLGERRLDEHRDDILTGLDKIMADWSADDINYGVGLNDNEFYFFFGGFGIRRAARSIDRRSSIFSPSNLLASSRFGVIKLARGNNSFS